MWSLVKIVLVFALFIWGEWMLGKPPGGEPLSSVWAWMDANLASKPAPYLAEPNHATLTWLAHGIYQEKDFGPYGEARCLSVASEIKYSSEPDTKILANRCRRFYND